MQWNWNTAEPPADQSEVAERRCGPGPGERDTTRPPRPFRVPHRTPKYQKRRGTVRDLIPRPVDLLHKQPFVPTSLE